MNVDGILFGAGGMLARSVEAALMQRGRRERWRLLSQGEADLTNTDRIASVLDEFRPRWIVNAAAYTDVNGSERETEAAFLVNARAVESLARQCAERGIVLMHISTDYVFDGQRDGEYGEDDPPNPINAYGRSKLAGEEAIRASGVEHIIARTSWLFAEHGRNFVLTMRRRLSGGEPARVVNDQRGRPTYAGDLAAILLDLMEMDFRGTIHVCNSGVATWFDLACRVRDAFGLTNRIDPCTTQDFPQPAARPINSVLSLARLEKVLGRTPRHWIETLEDVVGRVEGT
jgi:dTDP-4-dehydrorhamnose reductase